MGYGTRPSGNPWGPGWDNQIRTFTPDNTETEFWIEGPCNLSDAYDRALEHFGDYEISMDELSIEAHHIHTDCLGYDQYDSGDWTNFICITWNKS